MVMTVYGQEIPCARAERGADFVRAYDENGYCIFSADKVARFDGYSISGGVWDETGNPEPATNDDSVWDALDAAYQEGVNTAYDQ